MGVFDNQQEVNNRVNRNTFDWSFQNNMTMKMGYLYPVFMKELPPASSIDINPVFGLNFMPFVFPVQTRMRAQLSFFKVRHRSLWDGYKDFVGNFKQGLVKPYIDFNSNAKLKKMANVGSLGDYLGLPTTVVGDYGASQDLNVSKLRVYVKGNAIGGDGEFQFLSNFPFTDSNTYTSFMSGPGTPGLELDASQAVNLTDPATASVSNNEYLIPAYTSVFTPSVKPHSASSVKVVYQFSSNDVTPDSLYELASTLYAHYMYNNVLYDVTPSYTAKVRESDIKYTDLEVTYPIPSNLANLYQSGNITLRSFFNLISSFGRQIKAADTAWYVTCPIINPFPWKAFPINPVVKTAYVNAPLTAVVIKSAKYSYASALPVDITLQTSPYYNSDSPNKAKQLAISALPFRAYEAVYNAYYRDIRNNPFKVNGQEEYNIFVPTLAGGIDTNTYELRRRNWEKDFLTTAVPSPQQGRAPLIGITTSPEGVTSVGFTDELGDEYKMAYKSSKDGLIDIAISEKGENEQFTPARSMFDLVTSGISIADIRNVNAYQKYLEMNMRKGYMYRDIIQGHFDTTVRYDELNMPEFIGGTSQDVYMNQINQTVGTSDDGSFAGALGSYSGQATCVGNSKAHIKCYTDEECYIIGILSVTPVPNYSQLLPKHFLRRDLLDSYYPEFNYLGYQPIQYKEVCPIQAYNENPDSLNDTFGYNRAWYDYVANYDEVHGLFRTNLRNFLINRVFDVKPELSESFLLVDPEQVNDVFAVTETTDKILGQIYFDCKVKLPISRTSIPRLD